jgi:hypothetical protein
MLASTRPNSNEQKYRFLSGSEDWLCKLLAFRSIPIYLKRINSSILDKNVNKTPGELRDTRGVEISKQLNYIHKFNFFVETVKRRELM